MTTRDGERDGWEEPSKGRRAEMPEDCIEAEARSDSQATISCAKHCKFSDFRTEARPLLSKLRCQIFCIPKPRRHPNWRCVLFQPG